MSFTVEVYSPTSRKYKPVKSARSRSAALLRLSLVKGRARAKTSDGVVFAVRTEVNGQGKLSLVKGKSN